MLGAVKILTDRSSFFTTITTEEYKEFTDKIEVFKVAKGQPKIEATKKKSEGTDVISLTLIPGKKLKLALAT